MCAYRWQRRRSSGHTTLIELALPSTLRFLFLVYPLVTNVAFDAFPCFEFDDGTRWLKADVSIECNSHAWTDEVAPLAWTAVLIYPVGLLVLNALLLFAARRKRKLETPLSKATAFLHQECVPPLSPSPYPPP